MTIGAIAFSCIYEDYFEELSISSAVFLLLSFFFGMTHMVMEENNLEYFIKHEFDATNHIHVLCLKKFKEEQIQYNIEFRDFGIKECVKVEGEKHLLNKTIAK